MNLVMKKCLLLNLVAVFLLSCGKKSVKNELIDYNTSPTLLENVSQINGIWTTSCLQLGSGLFVFGHQKRELHIKDQHFEMWVASYKTNNCAKESMDKMMVSTGDMSFAGLSNVTGATNVNFTIASIFLGPLTDEAASWMNTDNGTCGNKTWSTSHMYSVQDGPICDALYTMGLRPLNIVSRVDQLLYLGNYYSSNTQGMPGKDRLSKLTMEEPYYLTDHSEMDVK